MFPCDRRWLPFVLVVLVVPPALAACDELRPPEAWDGQGILAIEGATVFTSPRVEPLENGVVVVMDGVVEAVGHRGSVPIPPGAFRVDGTGLSVLSGFWNGHVRIDTELLEAARGGAAEALGLLLQERFTRFGFTTVVETFTPRAELAALIERIESGEVPGPRILAVGGTTIAGIHLPRASEPPWSPELLAQLARDEVALVPALGLLLGDSGLPPGDGTGRERVDAALDLLSGFVRSGGRLLFGTGAGGGGGVRPLRRPRPAGGRRNSLRRAAGLAHDRAGGTAGLSLPGGGGARHGRGPRPPGRGSRGGCDRLRPGPSRPAGRSPALLVRDPGRQCRGICPG